MSIKVCESIIDDLGNFTEHDIRILMDFYNVQTMDELANSILLKYGGQSYTANMSHNDQNEFYINVLNGETEAVKTVLDGFMWNVDPSYNDNEAIKAAVHLGHTEIVKLLLTDPRVERLVVESTEPEIAYKMLLDSGFKDVFVKTAGINLPPDVLPKHVAPKLGLDKYKDMFLTVQSAEMNASQDDEDKLYRAVYDGKTEIVKSLLEKHVYQSYQIASLIIDAMQKRRPEIVKLLFNYVQANFNDKDNSAFDGDTLIFAAIYGYTEFVKYLLKIGIDPSYYHNRAIIDAAENGHTEIVKLLLEDPRVDPSSLNNQALDTAIGKGHLEIVKLLLGDPRVERLVLKNKEPEIAYKMLLDSGFKDVFVKTAGINLPPDVLPKYVAPKLGLGKYKDMYAD